MGQYLSPVVYSFALISANFSPRMALLYSLNPMTGSLNAFKWCLIGELDFHLPSFIISLAWLTFLIPAGLYRFRKAERNFVDLI
jgi:lipopolysaccharide transport system permease protein